MSKNKSKRKIEDSNIISNNYYNNIEIFKKIDIIYKPTYNNINIISFDINNLIIILNIDKEQILKCKKRKKDDESDIDKITYDELINISNKNSITIDFLIWIEFKFKYKQIIYKFKLRSIKDSNFDKHQNKLSCIYLFIIGSANELLNTNKYNENDFIFKYGYTNDICRRSSEHNTTYTNHFNTEIYLFEFSLIDPIYMSEAEKYISDNVKDIKLTGCKINNSEQKELFITNINEIDKIKVLFNNAYNKYCGYNEQLQKELIKEKNKKINKNYYILFFILLLLNFIIIIINILFFIFLYNKL